MTSPTAPGPAATAEAAAHTPGHQHHPRQGDSGAFTYDCAAYLAQEHSIAQFVSLHATHRTGRGHETGLTPPCGAVPDALFVHIETLPAAAGGTPDAACGHRHKHAAFGDVLSLLRAPALEALDRRFPVGVLIDNVGPWMASDADLLFALNTLRTWLPPGSAIAFTHATADTGLAPNTRWRAPAIRARRNRTAARLTRATGLAYRYRNRAQIEHLLAPWPLTGPGVAPAHTFFAGTPRTITADQHGSTYAAVALHPDQGPHHHVGTSRTRPPDPTGLAPPPAGGAREDAR
ncbi:SAM-dependent methyltransferase [Streptomyces rubiginosohelvolus]|uniref:SAM-dependent methyltransferase n=1 Tax=Streptomyces rubiginosohelvolus TaxID=67362 RepID=UPI0036C65D45